MFKMITFLSNNCLNRQTLSMSPYVITLTFLQKKKMDKKDNLHDQYN